MIKGARMGRRRSARNRKLPDWLYRRGDGSFYAIHPLTGKVLSLPPRDELEARRLYAPILARWQIEVLDAKAKAFVARIRIAERPAGGELFTAFCESFRVDVLPKLVKRDGKPLGAKTRGDYDAMLRRLAAAADLATPLAALDTQTLRQYLAQWFDSPKYYNYMRSLLNRLLGYAVDVGKLASNPMDGIRPRPVARRGTYMPDDHYVRITSQLDELTARACDLLYLISHNPADVLSLREDQITAGTRLDPVTDQARATVEIRLRRHKTEVPVEIWDWADSDLAATIDWFRDRKKSQRIIGQRLIVYGTETRRRYIGKQVSGGYISRRFAKAVVDAGFEKGTYEIRDLRPKGLSDEFVLAGDSDKGGHKTEAMKRHYRRIEVPKRAKNNLRILRKEG